jgi:predicted Holliday junction resolvase-like endonuclease
MKYLLTALLLSASPAIMADLIYMNQQMLEMRSRHQQQMLQQQLQQQEETRSYLQQQQEREERRLKQLNVNRHRERQARQEEFNNSLESPMSGNGLNRSEWTMPRNDLNR